MAGKGSAHRHRFVKVLGWALLLFGMARICFGLVFPHLIVQPVSVPHSSESGVDLSDLTHAGRKVDVAGRRLTLSYVTLPPSKVPDRGFRGTVFLLHGHGDCKERQIGPGMEIARHGYRVVIPDLPAHNESEGEYVTFGVREGMAIAALIDSLLPANENAGPIITWGHSLGGATAIQAAALNSRIDAVISVSTFSSLREVLPDYLDCFLPIIHDLLISNADVQAAITEAGEIAEFDPDDASTANVAERLDIPLLIVHGDADQRMPVSHAGHILRSAGKNATLRIIPGAGHTDVYATAGQKKLIGEIVDWIEAGPTLTMTSDQLGTSE